ncbi:hypothetical protein SH528x_003635 [Novipirellula sp. SH528]|uniref:hypothetical protein n=1 Tax=Novipirellula sp. SH528 TaxID=3454466 RepID=UPI003FA13575
MSRYSQRESVAEVDLTLEVKEEYLAIKGVEACNLTFSYKSADTEKSTEREWYRIFPDPKGIGQMTLRRGAGLAEFQLKLEDDGTLTIEGKHPSINSGPRFPIKAKLRRGGDNAEISEPSSDDPMILKSTDEN